MTMGRKDNDISAKFEYQKVITYHFKVSFMLYNLLTKSVSRIGAVKVDWFKCRVDHNVGVRIFFK